jgi:hypothetical protein
MQIMYKSIQIQDQAVFINSHQFSQSAVVAIQKTAVATCTVIHWPAPFRKAVFLPLSSIKRMPLLIISLKKQKIRSERCGSIPSA